MAHTLSEQQLAILNFCIQNPGMSLNVIARAGCGKTFTAIELAKILAGIGFVGAFNKSIAEELAEKLWAHRNAKAGTWHSIGLFLFRQIQRNFKVEGRKVQTIVRKYYNPFENVNQAQTRKLGDFTRALVSFAKQIGFGLVGAPAITEHKAWNDLAEYYDLWDEIPVAAFGEEPKVLQLSRVELIDVCIKVYNESLELCMAPGGAAEIDFDDMILAPLYFNANSAPMYDWVIIDEAQDTNEVRRRLAQKVLKPGGILIAVGDPAQAIYGFAGADSDSMNKIAKDMNSAELPLSITYRCGKAIVKLAQTWVPDIQAHESNPEGEIEQMGAEDFFKTIFFPSQDVIICRNTRPLIGIAKHLRQTGTPCVVEGVNYKGILALAAKWGEDITIVDMLDSLEVFAEEEVARLSQGKDESKVAKFQEKVDIVRDFAYECKDLDKVSRLMNHIEKMLGFSNDKNDPNVLTLCTVHRSKGREWHRVFLIGRTTYMPSKWAKAKWELEQEKNLMYVAVTRAKQRLVEVQVPLKKKRGQEEWWDNPRAADAQSSIERKNPMGAPPLSEEEKMTYRELFEQD